MSDNYWTRTEDVQRQLGGKNPICSGCGKEMTPCDDHGRFHCFSCGDPFARAIANALRRSSEPKE